MPTHALRASEERFHALVQFSFDVYWESDAQHRFTRQEFSERLPDAPARGSEIGKTRWEIPYVEPDEEAWREHRATLDAHLPFRDFELARPTADGGKRYVSVSGIPVFDSAGRFVGYRGVGRHITERKRVEAELRARQDMLDLAQKAARAVAFDWYIGARESENRWSPELEAMYGLQPGTFDGTFQSWKKLVHPDDWPAAKLALKRAHESGDIAAEYRVTHDDGTVHWLRAKGRMFFDAEGQPERMVGFMIDITDLRHAEEEHRTYLWFLESMDRVNRAIQGADELDRMTSEVLKAALEIFACDRAWLVYPCDPRAASWRADHGAHASAIPRRVRARRRTAHGRRGRRRFRSGAGGPWPGLLRFLLRPEDSGFEPTVSPSARRSPWRSRRRATSATCSVCTSARTRASGRARSSGCSRRSDDGWAMQSLRFRCCAACATASASSTRPSASRMSAGGNGTSSPSACRFPKRSQRIFGVDTPVALPQWQDRWANLIHPEDRARAAEAEAAAMHGGPRYDVEYRVVRPDGAVRVVHSQGDVVRDESGRPVRQFGVLQDITELQAGRGGAARQRGALSDIRRPCD